MPKTIIVPLDGSEFAERALWPARLMAQESGADVVLVTHRHGGVLVEPRHYLYSAGERAGLREPHLRVATQGSPVPALGRLVAGYTDPVICMSTHGRSGPGEAVLGSTAEDLVRHVGVPMVLVGPHVANESPATFEDVVICTDGSELSHAIVPVIGEWIRELSLLGTVVEVIDPRAARRAEKNHVVETAAPQVLARALGEQTGTDVDWEVLHSPRPRTAIVEFASARGSSLIALATHGRTGLARLAFGSVAAQIVHRAPCPVLVVRPPTLESEPST